MLRKYVSNWVPVLLVYSGLITRTTAKFKDGECVTVSRSKIRDLYEGLYRRYNTDHGFVYDLRNGQTHVKLPNGLELEFGEEAVYSHILDEVFLMKVYGQPDLRNRVAIDVGAAIGESALYLASLGAAVYAYEPNKDRYSTAIGNLRANKCGERVSLFNESLTGGSGPNSLETTIVGRSLQDVFIKMDCEGCERDLILGTDDDVFRRVKDITLECHGSSKEIVSRLARLGYQVTKRKEILCATRGDMNSGSAINSVGAIGH
jgi:hypothetical protein